MKRSCKFMAAMILAVVPVAAQIQISLDGLAAKASDTTGIALDASMLKLAANFLAGIKAQDPNFQKVLNGLKSIAVKRYTFAQEGAYQSAELDPLRSQLRTGGWGEMINVQRKSVHNEIFTKSEGGQLSGVTVVNSGPKEVAIVSVEGSIDLSKLAELAGHFGIPADIPGLDSVQKGIGGNQPEAVENHH